MSVIIGTWRAIRAVDGLTIITAPTMRQCKDVWLTEAKRMLKNAHPALRKLFTVTATKIKICDSSEWGVWAITASKPEAMQGLHQKNLTFLIDEASGVNRPIIEQIQGTLTNADSLLMMTGNPNFRGCAFFDCFNSQRHMWRTHTLNSEESPLVDPGNIRRLEEEYGKDSDVYRVRVLGEFPHTDPNCVMSSEDLEACTKTNIYDAMRDPAGVDPVDRGRPVRQFGIDFARMGSDESVVYQRTGLAITNWKAFSKQEPSVAVEHAFRLQAESMWSDDSCWYVADASGIGQGILHTFYDSGKQIHEFHNGGRASDEHYENKVTQAWFMIAKLAKQRRLHIPNDRRMIEQLSSRIYHMTKKGKLVLESKEEYKKRSVDEDSPSPDRADGMVMCYFQDVMAGAQTS